MSEKIIENIVNISIMAGYLVASNKINPIDSGTLKDLIIELAINFESLFTEDEVEQDYLGLIDEYATKELIKAYE